MKTLALPIAFAFVLSSCDTATNLGIYLGGQIVGEGIGWVTRTSDQPDLPDLPRSPGTSHLVCSPVGEKVVDPTTECHSEIE